MNENNKNGKQKTATDNQWISTGQCRPCDKTDRRDGPGGENAENPAKSK